jgi:hypothetical protein
MRSRSGLPGSARHSHSGPGALRPFGSRLAGGLAEPSNRPRQIGLGVEPVPGHDADVVIPVVVQRQLLAGSAPGGGVLALKPVTARSVPAGPAGPSGDVDGGSRYITRLLRNEASTCTSPGQRGLVESASSGMPSCPAARSQAECAAGCRRRQAMSLAPDAALAS